jgi:hypothetical protein
MAKKRLRDDSTGCKFCAGKGRVPTDMWNKETMAMWEPCHVCRPDDAKLFYRVPEGARQAWFVGETGFRAPGTQ